MIGKHVDFLNQENFDIMSEQEAIEQYKQLRHDGRIVEEVIGRKILTLYLDNGRVLKLPLTSELKQSIVR